MYHIKLYEDFIENLTKKLKDSDKNYINTIFSFFREYTDNIETFKEFNNNSDPDNILDEFIKICENSFNNISDAINKINNKSDFIKIYSDININITFAKKDIIDELKKLENNEGAIKILSNLFDKIGSVINKKDNKIKYQDITTNNKYSISDIRIEIKKMFDELKSDIINAFKQTNIDDLMKSSNIEKSTEEIKYNAGDNIRYNRKNGEEDAAYVSNNQEKLKMPNNIRLYNKDGKQFEIDKSSIIEIIQRSDNLTNKIKTDIKSILSDEGKIKRLSKFLDELKKEE